MREPAIKKRTFTLCGEYNVLVTLWYKGMMNRSFRWIRPEIDSKWLEEWLKECGVIGSWLATAL